MNCSGVICSSARLHRLHFLEASCFEKSKPKPAVRGAFFLSVSLFPRPTVVLCAPPSPLPSGMSLLVQRTGRLITARRRCERDNGRFFGGTTSFVSPYCSTAVFLFVSSASRHLQRDTRTNFCMHVAAACRFAFSSLSSCFMLSSFCLAQ